MPEHTPDPIDRLRSLRNGGLAVSPLPPEEVRRLGSRRRSRRHIAVAVASAAIVIAAVVPVTLVATQDSNNDSHQIGPANDPTATVTAEDLQVITFPEPGIEVVEQADTAKLVGTSEEFKTFIGRVADERAASAVSCPGAFHGVTVQKYSGAGYATGGVNACGGYVAVWVKGDAGWHEVMGGQEAFDCDELRYYDVPKSFVGGCYDYRGYFGPTDVGGLRLQMTAAQIQALHATLDPVDGPGCRGVLYADEQRIGDSIDGYLSPTKGLEALFARPGMKTPKGIGLGSSLADVRAAYPSVHLEQRQTDRPWVVRLDDTSEYQFGLAADDTVNSLILTRPDQDCFTSH